MEEGCIIKPYLITKYSIMIKFIKKIIKAIDDFKVNRTLKQLGGCGRGVMLFPPYSIAGSENIVFEDFVRIMPHSVFLIYGCKFIMKKYSTASYNFKVVSSNHRATVGVPNYFNNTLHINEVNKGDIIVNEDSWIGINCTLLPGANMGRGSVMGANSMLNKPIPPYAVVAGSPAKIIATRFSVDQIIEHERKLYNEEDRFALDYLLELFSTHYSGLKAIGTADITCEEIDRFNRFATEKGANIKY